MEHVITDASEDIVWTYNLCVIGPRHPTSYPLGAGLANWEPRIEPSLLKEAEENLTDLLPEGYRVEIKEWDSE